jgi:phosphoribosylaminoimidazolecarboxamide formyltransferase/IMP cyclohydrolase
MTAHEMPSRADRVAVRNVLVSVSDKAGLAELVAALPVGATVVSTGGTLRSLEALRGPDASWGLTAIEAYTEHPEMPGGLVKTLHPRVHAGLLGDLTEPAQVAYMAAHGVLAFDLVVVNLYPFEATVATPGATPEAIRQQIDIGGPAMLRAAAKNHLRVAAVVDPTDYPRLAAELAEGAGTLGWQTRFALATKAFAHVEAYDRAVTAWFAAQDPRALQEAWCVG